MCGEGPVDSDVAMAYMGLTNKPTTPTSKKTVPDSADPSWNEDKVEVKQEKSSSSSSPDSSKSVSLLFSNSLISAP